MTRSNLTNRYRGIQHLLRAYEEGRECERSFTRNLYVLTVEARDELSKMENELEDRIYDCTRNYTGTEIREILDKYHDIKGKRQDASELCALLFMSLQQRDKIEVSREWGETDEGIRNGLRGKID